MKLHIPPRRGIAALALASALLLIVLLGYGMYTERERQIDAASARTQELARLLEQDARQNMRRVELSLKRAADAVQGWRAGGAVDSQAMQQHLRSLLPVDGLIRVLAASDQDGRALLITDPMNPRDLPSVAGSDFFVAHRERTDAGLFIASPVKGTLSGRGTLNASIRLAASDGSFQGVLVAGVEPAVFERYYAKVDIGSNGFVTLFQRSGWIVARVPASDAIRSRNWAESPMFRLHLPGAASGTVRQVVAATGIESLYSYRTVEGYPLIVSVGLSLTDTLAAWRSGAWRDAMLLLLVLCALGAAVLTLLRQLKRREAVEKHLRHMTAIVETTSDSVGTARIDGQMIYLNPAARREAGIGADADVSNYWSQHFYGPERWAAVLQVARPAALKDGSWSGVTQLTVPDGRVFAVSQVLIPHLDERGEPEYFTGIARDISEIERGRALIDGQRQVLELIATGAPLQDTLTALVRIIEAQAPGMLGSVLLLDADGLHLRHGAGPNLPPDYTTAIDGVAIGEGVGSCGTAAFRREAVLVEDIAVDPLWKDFRELALQHGLRACWSTPIFASHGKLLGTFAMYRRQSASPSQHERYLIEVATQTAAIAIARQQSDAALLTSEARFRSLTALSSDWYWEQDAEFRFVQMDGDLELNTGIAAAAHLGLTRWDMPTLNLTASDWDAHKAVLLAHLPFRNFEMRRPDQHGRNHWVSINGSPLFDARGSFVGYRGVGSDISVRKQAELALQASLRDKEALLKEVHHRVKNNLQVVTSLLRLESRRSALPETVDVLKAMQARIHTMAQLHESLYRSGTFASVDLGVYLGQIATQAFRAQVLDDKRVRLRLTMGSVSIGMDQAVAGGLLVNELVSNCLKHSFAGARSGEVHVDLQPQGAAAAPTEALWRLRVSDTGAGLSADFEDKRKTSLGLILAEDLSQQVGGTLTIQSQPGVGAEFSVVFKALEPAALVMPS